MTGAKIDLGEQQNGVIIIRIARDNLVQCRLCLIHVVISQIGARQLVFDDRRAGIFLVESLQDLDRFFGVALFQEHVALQSAAVDVFRVAAKNIFKKRRRLVVFLVFGGKLGQQDPAREIIRGLLGHLGGNSPRFLGTTRGGRERGVFQAPNRSDRRKVSRFLVFFAGLFQILLVQIDVAHRYVRAGGFGIDGERLPDGIARGRQVAFMEKQISKGELERHVVFVGKSLNLFLSGVDIVLASRRFSQSNNGITVLRDLLEDFE